MPPFTIRLGVIRQTKRIIRAFNDTYETMSEESRKTTTWVDLEKVEELLLERGEMIDCVHS